MSYDERMVRVTGTGLAHGARARITSVHGISDGVADGRITITDGDGGKVLIDFDVSQNNDADLNIGGNGVLAQESIFVSALTNVTAITVVFTG